MKKQKLLIVVPSEVYGGGEVYIENLLNNEFFAERFEILLCSACERLNQKLVGFNTVKIKGSRSLSLSTFHNIRKINLLIREFDPGAVLLNGLPEVGVYSNYFNHNKIICIGHSNEAWLGDSFYASPKRVIKNLITLNFWKGLHKFIAINNCVFENTKNIEGLNARAEVIPTGIPDMGVVSRIHGSPIFGRISRLVPGKGNELLLEAFSLVLKRYPDASLVFAGDGQDKKHLVQYSVELGVSDKVRFLGHVDKKVFFSSIECMVSPSYSEASPLVVMESMSAGVPLISTKVGGVPEIVNDGDSARLIPPGDLAMLELAMIEFIERPELFKRFSEVARSVFLEKFELSIMSQKLVEVLE